MRYILLFSVLLFSSTVLSAQSGQNRVRTTDALSKLEEKEMQGEISISMDSLVEENYIKHLQQNRKIRGVAGYRIRIFSDNGQGAKDMQKRVRADFLSSFAEITSYYRYEGSYYKIYVGDFRTKRDALKVLEQIDGKFPDAFIVEDNIVIDE